GAHAAGSKMKSVPCRRHSEKGVWLAIQSASQNWTMRLKDWRMAMSEPVHRFVLLSASARPSSL
ncbi:hypothetical protein H0O27_22935, partial [Escherichia coli]|nr:hypothetical protein [Escherichia coli]